MNTGAHKEIWNRRLVRLILSNTQNKPALIFSGNGTQWPHMAKDLMESEPAFMKGAELFDKAYSELSGWSTLEMIRSGGDISSASKGNPCVLTVEIGLFSLLSERGIEASAVIGHSGGEIAAAYASGVLSIEDAAKVAWGHVCIIGHLAGTGTMAHISLSAEDLKPYLDGLPEVTIAARNSPYATILVGREEPLRSIVEKVEADTDVFCRMLRVDVPLHSPSVEPYFNEIGSIISGISPNPSKIPIYSTLYGRLSQDGDYDSWKR